MNDVIITPPEGYEIDKENSTFECIKFKPKELTYDDIAKELFLHKDICFIGTTGNIIKTEMTSIGHLDPNNSVSEKQCERLLAINQLMNVAYYFNEIVDKDVDYSKICRYIPFIEETTGRLKVFSDTTPFIKMGIVSFKTRKSAEKAIQILGEEKIKLAISLED